MYNAGVVVVHSKVIGLGPDPGSARKRDIHWIGFVQVPPGNNVASQYRLRVEGAGIGGGAIIFENETILEFSRQFLSVSISTNKAIYTGFQTVRN
jgi:hypothetical protein